MQQQLREEKAEWTLKMTTATVGFPRGQQMALAALETLPGGPPRQTGHSWHTAVVKEIAARWWKDDGTLEGQTQAKQVRSLLSKTDIGINEVC